MDARVKFACLTTLALWLAGCAQPQAVEGPPPFTIPFTSMLQTPQHAINPYQVLVYNDEADIFIGRGEKAVFGQQMISGLSAFTTYTTDAQAIATPGGFGYQYRYVVQSGVSIPVSP